MFFSRLLGLDDLLLKIISLPKWHIWGSYILFPFIIIITYLVLAIINLELVLSIELFALAKVTLKA